MSQAPPSIFESQSALLPQEWITRLDALYSEPQRHYHTASHIVALLTLHSRYLSKLHRPRATQYAILFHDCIYDPKSTIKGENEEKSLELFIGFAESHPDLVSKEEVDLASVMIRTTISHTLPNSLLNASDSNELERRIEDIGLFLDFDLSILAEKREVYKRYMEAIRKEYDHYSENAYNEGRVKVLKGFTARERLFFSRVAEEDGWEGKARDNMEYEIRVLEGGEGE